MILLIMCITASLLHYFFPNPAVFLAFIVVSLSMFFVSRLRYVGFIMVCCGVLYWVSNHDLTHNSEFIENKLFDAKARINEEFNVLRSSMYNDWQSFVNEQYSINHDRGYRIVDSHSTLLTWSGSEDFLPDDVFTACLHYPELTVYNNDISLRFCVKSGGKKYYLRHFLSNMYRSQDMKSDWLKHFEYKNSMSITLYVRQGQMYVNREVIAFNDLKSGEHVFIAEKNALYTKIDDSFLIKLQSPGISDYVVLLRKMFFFLTFMIVVIASFRLFSGKQILILHVLFGVALVIMLPYPLVAVCCTVLILIVDRTIIMDYVLNEIHHITYWDLITTATIFFPFLALLLQVFPNHMLIGAFVFGVFTASYFMYILACCAGFLAILFVVPHLGRHTKEGLAIVLSIVGMWVSVPMMIFLISIASVLFLTRKHCTVIRQIHILAGAVLFFMMLYPVYAMRHGKNTTHTIQYFVKQSEREVQNTMDLTADILRNDEQIRWTLAERINYDDNNFAFYKWSNTPLVHKLYPHFLYFENTDGDIISSFSFRCSLVTYPTKNFSPAIVDGGNFWMHRVQVFQENKLIGSIVVGIAKDYWRYDAEIPIVFTRKSSGVTVFSTGFGERPSSHFRSLSVSEGTDVITVWIKRTEYIIFRACISACGVIVIFLLLKIIFSKSFRVQFDFRIRMMLIVLFFLVLPFIFSTMLIFNNYTSSLKHYISKEVSQTRALILKNARTWYAHFYSGRIFNTPGAFSEIPWGNEWSLYSGPQRILSYNEDLYRLNLKRDYLPFDMLTALENKREIYTYFWGKGIVDVYYADPLTKGLTVRTTVALNRMQREDFFDTIILFMVINVVLIAAVLRMFTVFFMKIIYPLTDLIEATKEVSVGNFSYKIERKTDITEINTLLSNFNTMLAKLSAYKINLNDTQNFLREIIGSLPVAAVVYDKKRGIMLYNDDMERLSPNIELHRQPHDVIEIPVDFFKPVVTELRYKGHILRITIRHFKYGYIFTVSDITSFVIAEKAQVWFDVAQEIAHELKNPLMPLEFSVNRLEKATASLSITAEERSVFQELLTVMREETAAIGSLVRDFREMTQKGEANVNALDIAGEIGALVNGFKPYPILLNISEKLPLVYFPPNKLRMILKNILKNAIEAIPETKPIEISAYYATLPTEWNIPNIDTQSSYVVIHVKDNAGGIRQEIREQIFEPFYSSKKGGSGLGLYIVKKIMNEYGNEVYVQVREGEGSDMYLIFTTEHYEG